MRDADDEVPVADAVEQEQETKPLSDFPSFTTTPIEADASDWQEQHQDVVGTDDDDRDDYPGDEV